MYTFFKNESDQETCSKARMRLAIQPWVRSTQNDCEEQQIITDLAIKTTAAIRRVNVGTDTWSGQLNTALRNISAWANTSGDYNQMISAVTSSQLSTGMDGECSMH
jgi:hypothetical protein